MQYSAKLQAHHGPAQTAESARGGRVANPIKNETEPLQP
jgi:hypothetical protein